MALNLDTFRPSPLQRAILAWCRNGAGHAFVQAVAGSGKTTLLEWLARVLRAPGLFMAFNRSIAEELATRLRDTPMAARTVHSHGWHACNDASQHRLKMDGRKYSDLIFPVVKALAYGNPRKNGYPIIHAGGKDHHFAAPGLQQVLFEGLFNDASKLCKALAEKGRLTLTDLSDPDAVDALITQFGLEPNWAGKLLDRRAKMEEKGWHAKVVDCNDVLDIYYDEDKADWISLRRAFLSTCSSIARTAILRGFEVYRQSGVIDFTDMIWLPVALDLPVEGAPWIFVDEVQDLSACQGAIVERMCQSGTRILLVGDEDQSIYAFSGADVDSVKRLTAQFDCTLLPLSVTYRCPQTVIALARAFQGAANITPRDGAPLGVIDTVDWTEFVPEPGDLVLCRTTRPLVATCWELLKRGIPAYVAGKSIGAGLTRIAEDISNRPDFTWAKFVVHAGAQFQDAEARVLASNGGDPDDERIGKAADDIESVVTLWDIDQPDSLDGFNATVNRLFGERPKGVRDLRVCLCTAHRAKGLEADRVYLLKPQTMPHPLGCKTPSGARQEANLQYVTVTRAKTHFTFVTGEDPNGKRDEETGQIIRDYAWEEAIPFMVEEDHDESDVQAAVDAVLRPSTEPEPEPTDPTDENETVHSSRFSGHVLATVGALRGFVEATDTAVTAEMWSRLSAFLGRGIPEEVLEADVAAAVDHGDAWVLLACLTQVAADLLGEGWCTTTALALAAEEHPVFEGLGDALAPAIHLLGLDLDLDDANQGAPTTERAVGWQEVEQGEVLHTPVLGEPHTVLLRIGDSRRRLEVYRGDDVEDVGTLVLEGWWGGSRITDAHSRDAGGLPVLCREVTEILRGASR